MDANANVDYQSRAYQVPKIVKETPLSRLSGAVDHLRSATSKMSTAATTLCGEQIRGEAPGKPRAPVGTGVFGSIEELADAVDDLAADIDDYAHRINGRL